MTGSTLGSAALMCSPVSIRCPLSGIYFACFFSFMSPPISMPASLVVLIVISSPFTVPLLTNVAALPPMSTFTAKEIFSPSSLQSIKGKGSPPCGPVTVPVNFRAVLLKGIGEGKIAVRAGHRARPGARDVGGPCGHRQTGRRAQPEPRICVFAWTDCTVRHSGTLVWNYAERLCGELARAGPVGQAFLLVTAVFLLLHFLHAALVPAIADRGPAMSFSGLAAAYQFARRLARRAIWRLRNRLIVAYLFIAVVPIVLILALVIFAGKGIIGQVAVYLVDTELTRRESYLQGEVCALVRAYRPTIPSAAIERFHAGAQPAARHAKSCHEGAKEVRYPPDTQTGTARRLGVTAEISSFPA